MTGVTDGTEEFTVTAEDAGGRRQSALVRAAVYNGVTDINGTAVDIAGGSTGGSGTDPDDPTDPTDPTDPNQPPVVAPTVDPNACLDSDNTWGKVQDSWGTVEGQFSSDLHYYLRSQVSVEPSTITLYYKKITVSVVQNYLDLGEFRYTANDGKVLRFDMQMLMALVGLSNNKFFYVKFRNDCYRGNLPTSPLMPPNKTLTPVITGSLF
jgi:hypothetical protein